MAKKKKSPIEAVPAQSAPEAEQTPQIAKELLDMVGSLRAIATCHNLLDKGHFQAHQLQAIMLSMDFLKSLHIQAVTQALAHPQADLIPELKALKDAQAAKEQANG